MDCQLLVLTMKFDSPTFCQSHIGLLQGSKYSERKTLVSNVYSNEERFQSEALSLIVDAPWYVPNKVIRKNLQAATVKEETRRYSLSAHTNDLVVNLMELPDNTCQMICLPDFKHNCSICNSSI
jgi:hypothetical protein